MSEPTPKTDLIHRWCDGDEQALVQILEEDLPWLREFVGQRLGQKLRQRLETEDLVQEVMVELLRYGPRFRAANRWQFRALLGRIVTNVIHDEHKWHAARCRGWSREQPMPSSSVLVLDPDRRGAAPDQEAVLSEQQAWVRLALEFLEPEDRRVVLLRDWEELPFEAIGEHMGLTANTARMRYQRALPRLLTQMQRLRGGQVDQMLDAEAGTA